MVSKLLDTVADTSTNFVQYVMGPVEIAAADQWRNAIAGEASAVAAFYAAIVVHHGIDLSDLKPLPKGSVPRSNAAQAAFDFGRKAYGVSMVGLQATEALLDRNVPSTARLTVPGEAVPGVRSRAGLTYEKRPLVKSIFGAKEWGVFIGKMVTQKAMADHAAAVAAAAAAGLAAPDAPQQAGRGKPASRKDDAAYTIAKIGEVIQRLSIGVEKLDGSIPATTASKLAAWLVDALIAHGLAKAK
jgi:hypothetical protein